MLQQHLFFHLSFPLYDRTQTLSYIEQTGHLLPSHSTILFLRWQLLYWSLSL